MLIEERKGIEGGSYVHCQESYCIWCGELLDQFGKVVQLSSDTYM